MSTGAWTSEANKRYYVNIAMTNWTANAIEHYGYLSKWGTGLGKRKVIQVAYNPNAPRQELPEWLPLVDIEVVGPQYVPAGYADQAAFIRSQMQ